MLASTREPRFRDDRRQFTGVKRERSMMSTKNDEYVTTNEHDSPLWKEFMFPDQTGTATN